MLSWPGSRRPTCTWCRTQGTVMHGEVMRYDTQATFGLRPMWAATIRATTGVPTRTGTRRVLLRRPVHLTSSERQRVRGARGGPEVRHQGTFTIDLIVDHVRSGLERRGLGRGRVSGGGVGRPVLYSCRTTTGPPYHGEVLRYDRAVPRGVQLVYSCAGQDGAAVRVRDHRG